jgi:hypothetical protein
MRGRDLGLMVGMMLGAALFSGAVDNSWLERVPEADRKRSNPVAGQADAISAGPSCLTIIARSVMGRTHWAEGKGPACATKWCSKPPTASCSGS